MALQEAVENRATILIVDDLALTRRQLWDILTEVGYQVLQADSAAKALEIASSSIPDMILLDIVMPGKDGFQACRELKTFPALAEVPVIFISALDETSSKVNGFYAGGVDYISKPYEKEEVLARVKTHLSMRQLQMSLKNSNTEMEERVHQRTAELIAKHEQLSNLFKQVRHAKIQWEQTMDCIDDIVMLVGADGALIRCNKALINFTGVDSYQDLLGLDWLKLLASCGLDLARLSNRAQELFHESSGRWFTVKWYNYADKNGAVIALHDMTAIKKVSQELTKAYDELKSTHRRLVQQEKMASIGQLAAGVAHEINNPMGFISSNLETLGKYAARLRQYMSVQDEVIKGVADPESLEMLAEARKRLKIDYLLDDIPALVAESNDGALRVRTIVQNLKGFSRTDMAEMELADINDCMDRAVNIAWNELKYKVNLTKNYGELPTVSCYPQQLGQVFLNFLVNAAHAIDRQGEVTITTRAEKGYVSISVADTGCGIPQGNLDRIFEPFFTTKEVGTGTGLGLAISYEIIQSHGGTIDVESEVGKGTTFTVRLPTENPVQEGDL
ncbi:MAG: response regulator [Geobacteraceae bacterium]|nr:response regulator [Geobacteraceae bacterium]